MTRTVGSKIVLLNAAGLIQSCEETPDDSFVPTALQPSRGLPGAEGPGYFPSAPTARCSPVIREVPIYDVPRRWRWTTWFFFPSAAALG